MQIADGGGGGRKPSSTPVQKPAPAATPARNAGSKFALKNAGGARTPSAPTSRTDGVRVATPYSPGSRFALKNDGGVQKPAAAGSERLRAAGDGVRVATPYRPGSLFALKNDGTAGGGGRPAFTDQEALAVAERVHDAIHGDLIGTREGQAFTALRGLSPAEARQVAYQYEIKYKGLDPERTSPGAFQVDGSLLYTRLKGELEANAEPGATGHDWAQAQALLRGDTAKADAIALQTALDRPWLVPGGRENEILTVLRRAEPAERKALIEAFAKDFAEANHAVYRGMAGATQVPGTEMPQYDKDPATLVMNVLKSQLGGGDWTEAVGLITAAKYAAQPAVAARAQGEATVGRLYSLLDRPFPDRAAALQVLQGLGPEERAFVQGLATGQAEPTKLGQLLQNKLTDSELQQATAYLQGDEAAARATALHEALTRTSPSYGYEVPAPDVAAAEKILGQIASDDERRALLAAFERQYHQDPASLVPAVVGASRREVLVAQLRTAPTVLDSGASTLAGLGAEAVETGIDYRAKVLRLAIDSRLVGVAEDDVRRAFSGLDAAQARALAAQPLRPGEPGGRTLGDELGQWYRAGGGGRFTLELQQMLDGDAAATGDRQQQIDEAQAQYTLETTGPLVGVNDTVQRLFGNDARTVLEADAARLQAAEAALRASAPAAEPTRADMAVAYIGTGLRDYRTAKDATTEAAKTVVTTVAVVGTTVATGGTAAAVWAPVLAGAAANVAANQLGGASNSWQDDAVALVEGAANGLTLPGSAVTVRGGQYVVREAVEEGGQQVFRSVSRSVARETVERGLAEGGEEVLARGGQVILRDAAGRELTVQAFRPTLVRAIGQNVGEGVAGSVVGDVAAGTLRGDVNPQQVAANAVLAAGTAGLFSLGAAGAGRLAETIRGRGATATAGGVPVDVGDVSASSLPDRVIPVDRDIVLEAPTPPPEAADATMQAAFVDGMRRTGVSELGVRSSSPEARVWYGVGSGTGPVFPTKPGGPGDAAVNLGPAEVLSLNEARAAAGLPPLQEAFPELPIPRLVRLGPDGHEVWVRQGMLGGARVVVANPVRDASARVIDGDLVVAVSDVDLAYARHVDGHLLTDAEINAPGGLRDAINAAYGVSLGVDYPIVNHGAHFNGMQDARILELHDLDGEQYWTRPVHTFAVAANGYAASASLGDAYHRFVDPGYVPRSQRATLASGPAGRIEPTRGETAHTRSGRAVHEQNAAERRGSGMFDLVNEEIRYEGGGGPIEVPGRVDLETGEPIPGTGTQTARPDAVSFGRDLVLDDKPLGRPVSKDRQEIIRFIEAYRERTGRMPRLIAITRYDSDGVQVVTELYTPEMFLPKRKR